MKKRRRWPDEIRIPDHSASGDHRKRFGHQGEPEHAGLSGGAQSDQDGDQGSGAKHFQGESALRAHGDVSGKRTAAREVCRLPSRQAEGLRKAAKRRGNAGVRAEFAASRQRMSKLKANGLVLEAHLIAIKTYRPTTHTLRY